MVKLLRRNGKLQAHVSYYLSSNAKGPFGVVTPKHTPGTRLVLPKTTTHVGVRFFDSKTLTALKVGKRPLMVKAETARKMDLQ
jgi:hypothetical protein